MFGVLFHDLLYDVFEVNDRILIGVLIKAVAELVSQKQADDEELLRGSVGLINDKVEGYLKKVIFFGVLHEFVLD
jgi:hypothetical protein